MRCNFLVSALASLAVMLAKLTITLRREEITGKDGRNIPRGCGRGQRLGEGIKRMLEGVTCF